MRLQTTKWSALACLLPAIAIGACSGSDEAADAEDEEEADSEDDDSDSEDEDAVETSDDETDEDADDSSADDSSADDSSADDDVPELEPVPEEETEETDDPVAARTCETNVLNLSFEQYHSAFDGVQLYQVPAQVVGIDPAAVTWELSDPEIADIADLPEGVMLTIQSAGEATLTAWVGQDVCGQAQLVITEADTELWEIGSARYNDGVELQRVIGRGGVINMGEEPVAAACTSCHGESATNGQFQLIAHTPTQTAGFTDDELIGIFSDGVLPEGGYFDETIVSLEAWEQFHQWDMSEEQEQAMVVYLRSLTPSEQTGDLVRGAGPGGAGNGNGGAGMRPNGGNNGGAANPGGGAGGAAADL